MRVIMVGTVAEYIFLVINIVYLIKNMLSEKAKSKKDPGYKKRKEKRNQFLVYKWVTKESLLPPNMRNNKKSSGSKNKVRQRKIKKVTNRGEGTPANPIDLGGGAKFHRTNTGSICFNIGPNINLKMKDPYPMNNQSDVEGESQDEVMGFDNPDQSRRLKTKKKKNKIRLFKKRYKKDKKGKKKRKRTGKSSRSNFMDKVTQGTTGQTSLASDHPSIPTENDPSLSQAQYSEPDYQFPSHKKSLQSYQPKKSNLPNQPQPSKKSAFDFLEDQQPTTNNQNRQTNPYIH
jgi:hypothetical protein